jgi:serine/threonine-protein kinase
MLQCSNCGVSNKPGARFCNSCGAPLSGIQTIALGLAVQGRYQVLQLLGQGGMGAVYQVADLRIGGKLLAMKEMSDAAITDPQEKAAAIAAFGQEAQLLAQLDHANIPKVSDFFTENQKHYIVMELVPGETLENRLARQGAPCSEPEVRGWALQLCDVLIYLHGRNPPVIFRDLKPGNVMVTPAGQLKLIDFGIARLFKPGKTGDTAIMGTPGYAPPEQHGKGQTDARSDIYSLGVVMHHLLTLYDPATTPFKLPPARQINRTISAGMEAIIARATQLNVNQRYQTVVELRQDLLAGAAAPVVPSPAPPTVVAPPPPPSKRGVPLWATILVALVMLGAGIAVANQLTNGGGPTPTATRVAVVPPTVVPTTIPPTVRPGETPPTSAPRPSNTPVTPTQSPAPTRTYTPVSPTMSPTRTAPPPPTEDVREVVRQVIQGYGDRKPEFFGRGLNATYLGDYLMDPELEEQRRAVCWLRNEGKYYDYSVANRSFSVEETRLEGSNQATLVARISEHLILRGGDRDIDYPAEPYRAVYQLRKGGNNRWYIFCIHVLEEGEAVRCISELKDPNPCR